MIRLSKEGDDFVVVADVEDLTSSHENQLGYWGFKSANNGLQFTASSSGGITIIQRVYDYFNNQMLTVESDSSIQEMLNQHELAQKEIRKSLLCGTELKQGNFKSKKTQEFQDFINERIPRKLKDHQLKSALHLFLVKNGAIFSVPGSGKTTVALSVFHFLRQKGIVDALFVVGPTACFKPWRDEYKQVLGQDPKFEIFAGGDIKNRHSNYLTNINSVLDLYLTSFPTLHNDCAQVKTLFSKQNIRFYYVIDEAHYIKSLNGSWADAALKITPFAERRCVLTGTPFPKSYTDAFNLFDILWPESPPISRQNKQRISRFSQREEYNQASLIVQESIGPLFYRVRKKDLMLAPQKFNEPIMVKMNEHERRVYDSILKKIEYVTDQDFHRDFALVAQLRRGRMIRLRQCFSYTKLLSSAIENYDENLYEDDLSLAKLIRDYDEVEIPGKLGELITLVNNLRLKKEKMVIWSNFVQTLKLICKTMDGLGYGARLIYGETPLEKSDDVSQENTRESYIQEFIGRDSGIDILVANPAACAESISLHKTCSNAIYYDLSYNCAQYLQSLDRIHRVGGSENKESHYHFLQYENTVEHKIMRNLLDKTARMSQIIDQEYPIYSLDMFESTDEDGDLYKELFDGKS